MQSDHFRQDNERLIKLLAQTKEFANFGTFATDSGAAVRYLDAEKPTKKNSQNTKARPQTATKPFVAN